MRPLLHGLRVWVSDTERFVQILMEADLRMLEARDRSMAKRCTHLDHVRRVDTRAARRRELEPQ